MGLFWFAGEGTPMITSSLFFAGLIACMGSSMIFGYSMAVLNNLEWRVKCVYDAAFCNGEITNSSSHQNAATAMYSGLTASFVVLGTVSAFTSGFISDYFGRKRSLLINNVIGLVGGAFVLLTYVIKHVSILFISRLILGFNAGLTTGIAPTFLAEISPTVIRGSVTACHQLSITFGIFLTYLFTMDELLNRNKLWLISLAIPSIACLLSLILLPFFPESPRYLYINANKAAEAVEAFKKYNLLQDANEQLEELKKEEEDKKNMKKFRVIDLFISDLYRKAIILTVVLNVMQQFSGINAVIGYSSQMFKDAKVDSRYNQLCVLLIGLLNFLSTIPAVILMDKFGRRSILLFSSALLSLSLFFLFVCVFIIPTINKSLEYQSSIASVVFICLFIVGFACGLGPIPGIITAEMFTQAPRAAAYSLGLSIQWLSSFIILFLYPIVNFAMPPGTVFLIFFGIVIISVIYLIFGLPETKNRTFADIAASLAGRKVSDTEL